MLRLTARHANAWNTAWYGAPDERLRNRLADLDAALTVEGRDPDSLRRTVGMGVRITETRTARIDAEDEYIVTVTELAGTIADYKRIGIDDLIVRLAPMSTDSLDRLAQALEYRVPC